MALIVIARDVKVSGRLLNNDGEPEAYATVRIYNESDTTHAIAVGTSTDGGQFTLPVNDAGKYRIIISAVGKNDLTARFEVDESTPAIELNDLTLADRSMELGAVEVVAQRPLVTKEIDRIGYDVQGDAEAQTSNVQDILRKVPMVTVDADGTIKINGSSDFKIYKNGRPNNTFTSNAKDVFKAIPASTIKKIEVITDPGSREDAEGVGAILNIVTMQNAVIKGVMGSAGLNFDSRTFIPNPYIWLTTQINKVTFSVNGGTFYSGHRNFKNHSSSEMTYDESRNTMLTDGWSDYKKSSGMGGYISLEGSYDIDTLNLVTVELSGWMFNQKYPQYNHTEMLDPTGDPIYSYNTYTHDTKYRYTSIDGSVNYQHSTHRKGETVTLSYMLSSSNTDSRSNQDFYDLVNPLFNYTGINSTNNALFMEHTGQLDWTRPLNDRHKFDVGGKFIYRHNGSDGDRIYVSENPFNTPTDYRHTMSIGAAYFDWRSKFGKFTVRGGLRYEFSRLTSHDKLNDDNNFAANLSDWVPMAAVNYNISDAHTIKLSYNTRISRPDIYSLNPTVTVTPTSVSYGNPDLGSALSHTITLNYNLIHRKINADASISYRFSNDGVHSITWVEDVDGQDITYSTYGNIGKSRRLALNLYMNWMITPKTSWMVNGQVERKYYSYPSPAISASRWGGNGYTMIRQQLPWKLSLQLWGSVYTGGLNGVYGYSVFTASNINYGIRFMRNFLKEDRLQVNVGVMNPFGPYSAKYISRTMNSGVTGESIVYYQNRCMVGINISYRFGSLNAYVKKTNRSVSNDDVSRSKPSTGGM
ncbi:MAG: TonB-dependent receptor family protein [Muribaculaceae bacterium]|nr:TonB-dependent receptor family protein [Muribaculaceae bacterium]